MEQEEWRPVIGLEGKYSISNTGRVRSHDRYVVCSDGERLFRGKELRPVKGTRYGHLQVNMSGRREYVHRLVLEAFKGECPTGMECRHLDGDPSNNNVRNLEWGSPLENSADAIGHDTMKRKLTSEQALEIRERNASGESQRSLALGYGVCLRTIQLIVHGITWKWLE